jgi:hypothetical protein
MAPIHRIVTARMAAVIRDSFVTMLLCFGTSLAKKSHTPLLQFTFATVVSRFGKDISNLVVDHPCPFGHAASLQHHVDPDARYDA